MGYGFFECGGLFQKDVVYGFLKSFQAAICIDYSLSLHLPAFEHWAGGDVGVYGGDVPEDEIADL